MPVPIQIRVPPDLVHLRVNVREFLEKMRSLDMVYDRLVVAACIFSPKNNIDVAPRLLVVQRAETEHTFPNLWEVPGGSCEPSDPSVSHSLARETFEETGLRLTRFIRQVGDAVTFTTPGGLKWLKLVFQIEVLELHGEWGIGAGFADSVRITLDPEEHQKYSWATEDEIKQSTTNSGPYPTITEPQRQNMLQAFELYKADRDPSWRLPRRPAEDAPDGGRGWPEVREYVQRA